MLTLITAVSLNGVIGNSKVDTLPWHCTEELQFFKNTTMGKTLVMGRTTAEQVGKLPGRNAIVLSNNSSYKLDGFDTMTLDALLIQNAADPEVEYMICGGAAIYKALLPFIDQSIISYLHFTADGDVYFPTPYTDSSMELVDEIPHDEFTVTTYKRSR